MNNNDNNSNRSSILRNVDFTATGGEIRPFDDGHTPENLQHADDSCYIVNYPQHFDKKPSALAVVDDAMDTMLVQDLYDITVSSDLPWGTYVTRQDIQACQSVSQNDNISDRQHLATLAAACFMRTAKIPLCDRSVFSKTYTHNSIIDAMWQSDDYHGVAVWALKSKVGSQVSYHLDYAEQVRYATNVIVPPVLAGTLQCTNATVKGGEYWAYLHDNGIQHYEQHGYKTAKQELQLSDDNWVKVAYTFNRLTIQSGHLPHLSTKVESISAAIDNDSEGTNEQLYRVIVGFNVFLDDIGPIVQAAPEHSDAFRQQVTRQRTTKSLMKVLRQNTKVRKALAHHQRRTDFTRRQVELDAQIKRLIQQDAKGKVTVSDLIKHLANNANQKNAWPTAMDVQIHIVRRCKEHRLRLVGPTAAAVKDENDLLPMDQVVELI